MICPHGSSVGELLDPPCHLCRIEELEAQIAALKQATVRPNPADFGAWSQESLAKFAQEVWEENLRLRAAVSVEREECAQLAEKMATCGCGGRSGSCQSDDIPLAIAANIRNRAN